MNCLTPEQVIRIEGPSPPGSARRSVTFQAPPRSGHRKIGGLNCRSLWGGRGCTQLFAEALTLDQVAEHRLGQEKLRRAIAGPLELVMAAGHVVDQIFHPQQGSSPISHGGVILHSIPGKNTKPRSIKQIAADGVASGETAWGSRENRRGSVQGKARATPDPGPAPIRNFLSAQNLRKNQQNSEKSNRAFDPL